MPSPFVGGVGPAPGSTPGIGAASVDGSSGVDAALVQQTKHEIRQIVQEIQQLAQQDIPQERFVEEFLPRIVSALAAVGGSVWTTAEDGGLQLQYQINYPASTLNEAPVARTRHALLLRNVLQSGHPTLVPPQSGSTDVTEAGNPTDFLLILAPLRVNEQTVGIVEIFQRAGGGPTTQRGYLRFLVQMADLAGDYLKSRELRSLGDRQMLWESLERYLRIVHGSLDTQSTVFTIVNESRTLIQCERVSLALRRGSRYVVQAVSGLDSLDRRAAEIKLLSRLATAVAAAGQPLWYAGPSDDLPPQIETPLHEYLDQAHAKLVFVVPLRVPSEEIPGKRASRRPPLGVLIVEKLGDDRLLDGLRERTETVAMHSTTALANALEHQSLFLLPLWKALGRLRWIVEARTLPKTLLAVAAVTGAGLALALVPADFDLAARGKLQPSIRRDVFAQVDGVVVDVPVRHEQDVAPGQLLCKMTNSDLEVQAADLEGRQRTTRERISNIQRSRLDDRRLSVEARSRLDGELLELQQVEESIEREMALLAEKQELLEVRSEMAGQVVTWNVRDILLRRPVEKGQVMLSLVDPRGPWELELYMPERRMGHVARSAREFADGLAVKFMLASHPGREFTGRVVEMHRSADLHGDEGNSVVLRVAIDQDQLPELRSDTTVTARVHCGSRAVGYVWFHEVLETIQTKVLFWL